MRLNIKTKLVGTFLVVLSLLAGLSWLSITSLSSIDETVRQLVDKNVQQVAQSQTIVKDFVEMDKILREHIGTGSEAGMTAIEDRLQVLDAEIAAAQGILISLASPDEMVLIEGIKVELGKLVEAKAKVIALSREGSLEAARVQSMDVLPGKMATYDAAAADLIAALQARQMPALPQVQLKLAQIDTNLAQAVMAERNAILEPIDAKIIDHAKLGQEKMVAINSVMTELSSMLSTVVPREYAALQEAVTALADHNKTVMELSLKNTEFRARDMLNGPVAEMFALIRKNADALKSASELQLQAAQVRVHDDYLANRTLFLSIAGLAMLVGIGSALWMSIGISRGLNRTHASPRATRWAI
jgi:methyl-accepting chemotaxis protein